LVSHLREKHRPKVLENRMLRRLFELKRGEIIGRWRTLHNEELHNFYFSPNVIRMIRSMGMRWEVM
jgi:hypothetical protein